MLVTILSALKTQTHFIWITVMWSRYYYTQLTNEETEIQQFK